MNAEATCFSAEALSAGGVAGQRLAIANTPNAASSKSSVLNEDDGGIVLRHQKEWPQKAQKAQKTHFVLFVPFVAKDQGPNLWRYSVENRKPKIM